MQTQLKIKLGFFMFLQYFVWGTWYVSMATYLSRTLHFGGEQIGLAYGAFAIGAMISPFCGADRRPLFSFREDISVPRFRVGSCFCAFKLTTFSSFYPVLIIYCASYVPTLATGTSLALHHLSNPKRDLPTVKALTAVGWIAAG